MQSKITVGDTLNFTTAVKDYPASDGWTLKFRLIPRVIGVAIDIDTAPDTTNPDLHRTQVTAATTSAWAAGIYSWASWVVKATEAYSVEKGEATLLPDPRVVTAPLDLRTQAQIALDQARAAFAAWSPTSMRYKIGEREMFFNAAADILKVISYWENVVRRERACATGIDDRKIHTRLGRA